LVEGEVVTALRLRNTELATGDVEVTPRPARRGPAETPAIPVARGKGEELPAEELRLSTATSICGVPSCKAT